MAVAGLPTFSIRVDKLTHYLLDLTSIDGASKAKFFLGHGFPADNFFVLLEALANHSGDHWPGRTMPSPHGLKHILEGPMMCPNGTTPIVRSVWMLTPDGTTANFVTAYPA